MLSLNPQMECATSKKNPIVWSHCLKLEYEKLSKKFTVKKSKDIKQV